MIGRMTALLVLVGLLSTSAAAISTNSTEESIEKQFASFVERFVQTGDHRYATTEGGWRAELPSPLTRGRCEI